jgi:hypothetical protein
MQDRRQRKADASKVEKSFIVGWLFGGGLAFRRSALRMETVRELTLLATENQMKWCQQETSPTLPPNVPGRVLPSTIQALAGWPVRHVAFSGVREAGHVRPVGGAAV